MAEASERLRLGTCVTNPATREPSVTASALAVLNELSEGRMDLGIGRGDSARRVLGKPPTTMKTLEEAIGVIRDLVEGRAVTYEGTELQLPWTGQWSAPGMGRGIWTDGDRDDRTRRGRPHPPAGRSRPHPLVRRRSCGRPRPRPAAAARSVRIQAAAPAHVAPRDIGRERTRWFPALVGNHVVDLVNKYPREQLPEALTGYVGAREGYDYRHHAEVGSSNAAFVGDEVTDRFCVLGDAEEHVAKLEELADAGVDQFNLYLMNGDEEAQLDAYAAILPRLAGTPSGR